MPYDGITATGERQLMRTENYADCHGTRLTTSSPGGGNGFGAQLDAPAYDHIGQIEVVPGSHKMCVELGEGGRILQKYYADRRDNFPPDHGKSTCSSPSMQRLADNRAAERASGTDYGAGVERYAFAAPFAKIEEQGTSVRVQEVS
ncbi:Uu.00g005250.m01.CDS01 [Anthostomella pinea]|uniref:Uu.00g005250.m01.CDS01 n=1 Tax=Anthostomella pinea TaxID=933095 RepID=A0AAI8VK34_9PEZI|nr:Uu.00g005250.m01.CDS01 [Anthostomella pinea]